MRFYALIFFSFIAVVLLSCSKEASLCERNYEFSIPVNYSIKEAHKIGDTLMIHIAYGTEMRNLINREITPLGDYIIRPQISIRRYDRGPLVKLTSNAAYNWDFKWISSVEMDTTSKTAFELLFPADGKLKEATIQLIPRYKGTYYISWTNNHELFSSINQIEKDNCTEYVRIYFTNPDELNIWLIENPSDLTVLNPQFAGQNGLIFFKVNE